MMWVFPLAAAVVAGIFTALVGQSYITARKPHNLAWALALLTFATASFAAAMGMIASWTPFTYRVFYLFGAIVNVPLLALGTLYLLAPRKFGHFAALIVFIASVFAAGLVFGADVSREALGGDEIPMSSAAFGAGTAPVLTARYISFIGFFIVVGGALWSAWRLARNREPHLRALAMGNILIALGTTVVAAASAVLRLGRLGSAIFSVGLLMGIVVMFTGFLRTKVRPETEVLPDSP